MPDPTEQAADDRAAPQSIALRVNGERFAHDGDPEMPLLWYLRDVLGLTGTKYACDDGSCGACTVLVGDKAVRSCGTGIEDLAGSEVTTVEGLEGRWRSARDADQGTGSADRLHPLQQAFIDEDAIQCGYCLPGFLMAATALLERKQKPTDQDIERIDNLCRCCVYPRIRAAILRAAANMRGDNK